MNSRDQAKLAKKIAVIAANTKPTGKVFGDARRELLADHARKFYVDGLDELGEAGEEMLYLELDKGNGTRCAPPLANSALRALSVASFSNSSTLRARSADLASGGDRTSPRMNSR